MIRKLSLLFLLPLLLPSFPSTAGAAEEPVDYSMMTRIRDEGLHRSQVMDTLYHLTDVIGPRLTGSPQLKAANEWTRDRMAGWGLANSHLEGYPFGRGWSFSGCQVRMISPRTSFLFALPKAWTAGTNGPVRGAVMRIKAETPQDLEAYSGKVAGKILLLSDPYDFNASAEAPRLPDGTNFSNLPEHYSKEDLEKIAAFEIRGERSRSRRAEFAQRLKLRTALREFVQKEKPLATVEVSSRADGILGVSGGGSWEPGKETSVPALVMTAEHYNEILRLLDHDQPVELELDVAARFHDEDLKSYNTVAEIPGTDKRSELVMAGAHLDSWHTGTGATDNAAGSAIVMEAARILQALGVKPRRTIRIVLWSGEEQGYYGSNAYVRQHFATRPESKDDKDKDVPEAFREETWPLQLKPDHAKVSVYFNIDNGGGRIRGIYAQENAAVQPIFAAWLAPFADLGADTVTLRDTGSTDHVQFDGVGIPGFQFIQDPLDYYSRTHHSDLDTYDHVPSQDMMQASVIMAAFLYDAAMRPEMLPRKPLPQGPPPKKPETKKETAP
jgi:carboxypeptidase Q